MTKNLLIGHPENRNLVLRDKRVIGYHDTGDPQGYPVIFFHGSPGSRLEGSFFTDLLRRHKLRMIAPDRPGAGLSTFNRNQTFQSFSRDLTELIEHLGLAAYSIIAISGGVPFALAFASEERVSLRSLTLLSGIGPLHGNEAILAQCPPQFATLVRLGLRAPALPYYYFPILFNPALSWYAKKYPTSFIGLFAMGMCLEDKITLREQAVALLLTDDFFEGLRNGSRGAAMEFSMFLRDWPFDITQVKIPVKIWHGAEDQNVPVAFAHYLGKQLQNSTVNIVAREGHFSLSIKYANAILTELALAASEFTKNNAALSSPANT